MNYIKKEFLKSQDIKPWFQKRFIDDIFFVWKDTKENLDKCSEDLNKFTPKIKN